MDTTGRGSNAAVSSGVAATALVAPPVDAASLSSLPAALARDVALVRELAVSGKVLQACAHSTGMRFTAIARVTPTHWVACDVRDGLEFGLGPGGELPVHTTLCDEVVTAAREIVIRDVPNDAGYAQHPCPATYGFRSYVSVPIRLADGSLFGTLCALDPEPRELDETTVLEPARLYAELVGLHVDAARRLAETSRALDDERTLASLREEFIAVVGHDLRNPLSSIDANAQLIDALAQDAEVREANAAILRSSARMGGLIANLMDFARGRLGGGIEVARERTTALGDTLEEVVHGASDRPIEVRGVSGDDGLRLTVVNGGEPIPAAVMDRMFEPFRRAHGAHGACDGRTTRDDGRVDVGLGLGLHIAGEIALAHVGRIDVRSDAERTTFTFTMPTRDARQE